MLPGNTKRKIRQIPTFVLIIAHRLRNTSCATRCLFLLAGFSLTFFLFQFGFPYQQSKVAPPCATEHILRFANSLGRANILDPQEDESARHGGIPLHFRNALELRRKSILTRIQRGQTPSRLPKEKLTRINLALVACESRGRENAKTLLKSALLFSQDAHLHVCVFSDNRTIPALVLDMLELKWTASTLGWEFTFKIHPEWFPPDTQVPWRQMWAPCSTQRLFLPSMMAGVDAAIYLDADILILSNLTEVWLNFEKNMKHGDTMVAMAANSEETHPDQCHGGPEQRRRIPQYGDAGLQAGVVLMNLTRMREFGIENRSVAAYNLYYDKLELADQDIYNIIFHTYTDRIFQLDCTLDFTHVHCGQGPKQTCLGHIEPGPICFCNSSLIQGVRIVHGNGNTFRQGWPFLMQLYETFQELDLLLDDPLVKIKLLMSKFNRLEDRPVCFGLTSSDLYKNAVNYLENTKRRKIQ